MLSAPLLKVVILFTLLITTFLFSMLPLVAQKLSKRQHLSSNRRRNCRAVVSALSCFAAGVFIGVCLLDLLPEVESKITGVLDAAKIQTSFPLPEFIVVIGFLLLLFVEQFVLTWKSGMQSNEELAALFNDCDSIASSYGSVGPPYIRTEIPRLLESPAPDRIPSVLNDSHDALGPRADEEEDVYNEQMYVDPSSHSIVRSLILIIALSLHSLFEGLAVGLQPTVDDTLQLFIALALHKCILAFSLGLNMVQSKLSTRAIVISNVSFSLASPVGTAIGIGITDMWSGSTAANLTIGALQGIACGTFIYVVFFEILPREFMKKRAQSSPDRLIKVLCLIFGFSVVVAVLFLDPYG